MELKEKKKVKVSPIQIILLIIAASLFAFSAYKIITYVKENKVNENTVEELIDMAVSIHEVAPPDDTTVLSDSADPNESTALPESNTDSKPSPKPQEIHVPDPNVIPISVDFSVLKAKNPDIVGWIYGPNTLINYPILQAKDNDYYLERLVDGRENPNGSIFMDFRNNSDLSDMNTLIYGHNMASATMFGSLVNYKYKSYFDTHPFLWIITEDGAYRLDVISAYTTDSKSDVYTIFNDEKIFKSYLTDFIAMSNINTGVSEDDIKNIVTLSTCSNREDTERYVVLCHPVLVK